MFVYSICDGASFDMIPVAHRLLSEALGTEKVPKILVGNYLDMSDKREVSVEEGKSLAEKLKCPFVECSARTGQNVSKVFTLLLAEVEGMYFQRTSMEVPTTSNSTRCSIS